MSQRVPLGCAPTSHRLFVAHDYTLPYLKPDFVIYTMSWTATTTFAFSVENHAGMQMLGALSERGHSLADLQQMAAAATAAGAGAGVPVATEIYCLNDALAGAPELAAGAPAAAPAHILVVRHGVTALLCAAPAAAGAAAAPGAAAETSEAYAAELRALPLDKKALMRGRVVNKHARWNVCFDDAAQAPDYAAGRGTVVPWAEVPLTARLRAGVEALHPSLANIKAEYNDYYDIAKCGIGYHGDTERREVIAARCGAALPIYYQWFWRSQPVGPRVEVPLGGDDLYVMSEKAVGTDWKRSSQLTLRHATGCDKFTVLAPPRPTVRLAAQAQERV